MNFPNNAITSTIQLALAPVFMLTAVAALIPAINARMARIVDRMRFLHAELTGKAEHHPALRQHYALEFQEVRRRGKLCAIAVFFDVLCGLLISLTVLELFFFESGATEHLRSNYVFVTFISGMLCFMTALVIVLLEVIYSYWSTAWNLPFHDEGKDLGDGEGN